VQRAWAIAILAAACGRIGFTIDDVGCTLGTRAAFADTTRFPDIAGCAGRWLGQQDLSAPPSSNTSSCARGECNAPADACAYGWHMCSRSGDIGELVAIAPSDCDTAGSGRFVAAVSHDAQSSPCTYFPPDGYTCMANPPNTGGQPPCCGSGCVLAGCPDGVWPGDTHIPSLGGAGCANLASSEVDGVLCCRDR
jgi:hypothetical protein